MVTLALDENTPQIWQIPKVGSDLKTKIIHGTAQGGGGRGTFKEILFEHLDSIILVNVKMILSF